ncbi:MAG: zinc ribbon domain-containing protein [Desulfobulbaceae bacterium]|nr:zinc ribbon domain-containing protein [Desulfobulbaceae bacterium]
MPIYEYECNQCDKTLEVSQSIKDAPLSTCPDCGQPVRKLISASSFLLKGGGWYADGYTHAKDNAKTPADSKPAPPPCRGGSGSCAHCPASS